MCAGTLEGEDSAGADSGRRRGGMGGGTGSSSFRRKLIIDDTEEDPEGHKHTLMTSLHTHTRGEHGFLHTDIFFTCSVIVTLRCLKKCFSLPYMSKTNFSQHLVATFDKTQDWIYLVEIPCSERWSATRLFETISLIRRQCWAKMINVCPLSLSLYRSHISDLKHIQY